MKFKAKKVRRTVVAAAILLGVNVVLGVATGRLGIWDALVSPVLTVGSGVGALIFWVNAVVRVLERRFPQVGAASSRAAAVLTPAWKYTREALCTPAFQVAIVGWVATGWAITLALNVVALISSALGSVTKTVADMNPFGGGGDAGGGLRAAGSLWAAPLDILTNPLYLLVLAVAIAVVVASQRAGRGSGKNEPIPALRDDEVITDSGVSG